MSIKQRVTDQLEQLVANGPDQIEAVIQKSPDPGYIVGISAEGQGARASISFADYDRYSVTLRHLEVYNHNLTLSNGQIENFLHRCAAEIAQRLIYLEEPLALVELNTIDGIAQLRSNPPQNGTHESMYWEVMIRATPQPQIKLARYRWTAGTPERVAMTYPATFATLGRLSEDLAASLQVELGD